MRFTISQVMTLEDFDLSCNDCDWSVHVEKGKGQYVGVGKGSFGFFDQVLLENPIVCKNCGNIIRVISIYQSGVKRYIFKPRFTPN